MPHFDDVVKSSLELQKWCLVDGLGRHLKIFVVRYFKEQVVVNVDEL
jgi:hypothetical protein